MIKKLVYSAPTTEIVELFMTEGIAQASALVVNEIVEGTSGEDFIWD